MPDWSGFANSPLPGRSGRFRWPSIPVLTFGILAALVVLIALPWAWGSYQFLVRALRAPGKVIRIEVEYSKNTDRNSRSTGPSYCPVVRFTSAEEKTLEITGLGAGEPDYAVGDEVTVLYLPNQPKTGKIESFQELWLGPLVFGVMGAIFGGLCLLMIKLKF